MDQHNKATNTDITEDEAPSALSEEAQEAGQAQEMEFHPLCELFPPMSDEEFKSLMDSIKAHGLLALITTYEGKILDGRHCYKACLLAGVESRFEEYQGNDPVGFVIAKNMARRHLTTSQRAMLVAELEKFGHGGKRQDANLHFATRSEVAQMMVVSPRLVASAKVVKEKGSPDLIEAVRLGKMSVSEAEAQIKKTAGGPKAKANAEDATNKVTGERSKTRGKASKQGPSSTEAERQAGFELLGRLVESCDPGQSAELAELAEKAAPYYGQMCRDLANRLRQAEEEADQQDGAKAA
jgi:hypothetical protein